MDDFSWQHEPLPYDYEKNEYIYPHNFEELTYNLPSKKKFLIGAKYLNLLRWYDTETPMQQTFK